MSWVRFLFVFRRIEFVFLAQQAMPFHEQKLLRWRQVIKNNTILLVRCWLTQPNVILSICVKNFQFFFVSFFCIKSKLGWTSFMWYSLAKLLTNSINCSTLQRKYETTILVLLLKTIKAINNRKIWKNRTKERTITKPCVP